MEVGAVNPAGLGQGDPWSRRDPWFRAIRRGDGKGKGKWGFQRDNCGGNHYARDCPKTAKARVRARVRTPERDGAFAMSSNERDNANAALNAGMPT